MKKIVAVVVVLVLVLAVAPWGIGKVAEKRVDHGLEQLVKVAPYLKVVDNKWTSGWFKSEQVVTFEAFGAWFEAMSPKALEEAMKKDAADADVEVESEVDEAVSASPDAVPEDAAPQAADPPADAPSTPEDFRKLMRFTIRNEVLHGPILGLSGFGIARVNSQLVLSDETRKEIEAIFGPKDPLKVSTRVGFLGGGTTTFTSEGRTIKPKDGDSEVTWETFKLAIGYSRNADKYDIDGKWPKLEVKDSGDGTHFVMSDMAMDGGGKRVRGDLYDGDFNFAIDKVSITGKADGLTEIADVNYVVNTTSKGEFTGIGAKMGTGPIKSKQFSTIGLELKEVHYDFSVQRLHTETLANILADLKAVYATPLTNGPEAQKVMFAPLKERGMELLKYDPEFVIERIGIATADGDGYLKGVIRLKGATADDFAAGSMSIIGKLHADLTVDLSQKMVEKFPNGATMTGAAVDSGYLKRDGDRLICKIVFADGNLTVNGKPQAIPGLGGPPGGGGAMPE
jgi:uncharacterized protein YdgA (DUF945 family)